MPEEFLACRPYLLHELVLLKQIRVVLALGQIAFSSYLTARKELHLPIPSPVPRFGHGSLHAFKQVTLIGSYHPSQQNTFTGRLTKEMFHAVFLQAREVIKGRQEAKDVK